MPSPPGADARRNAIRSRIQIDLAECIVNPHSIGDAYIRQHDIERVWSGHGTIEHALYPVTLSSDEVAFIRDKLLTFLSILVYIDAHVFLADVRTNVLGATRSDGEHRYANSRLPFGEKEVPDLGSFMLRKRFLDEQYLFVPEVLVESDDIQQISDQRRLPFESVSRDLFAGAYGKIDKVGISSSYFKSRDGRIFPEVKYVACKRFHAQLPSNYNNTKRELDNLKVLKKSITSHSNIRLHLAIILHKNEHLILLPWADHLDLEIFLNEGRDFLNRKEIYNFKLRFKNIQPGTMINDICTQMHHVADALKWLHEGITMVGNSNPIRFAHMDLKPNNILIDSDDGYSAVGKWVLTDFGISAFKEDDGADADKLMSIRDYYQNLTINTTPRRDSGAYQPPEVEHMSIDPSERRSPEQGSVGRRGDIWSFACIFTEVLAFSLGQAALLKEFRTVRKGKHPNDYFYESYELQDEALHPYGKQVSFRVRPQIIQWLRALPARYSFPKKAIDCCVETIQRVLIVDGSRRPKAYELMKLFNHVASHIDSARAPGGPPPNCPLEARTPSEPLLVTSRSTRGPPTPFPPIQIKRTNTKDEEELLTQQSPRASSASVPLNVLPSPEHEQLGHDPQHTNDVYVRRDDVSPILRNTPVPIRDREDSFLEHGSPLRQSVSGLGIFADPARTSSLSEATQMPIRSRPSSRSSRRDLHGVMINQDRVRRMGDVAELALVDRSRRLVSVSLSPSGRHVAYLVEDKKSRYAIHTFTARTECQKAASRLVFHALNSIALPTGTKWEGVVANEAHLVAWGNIRAGSKQVLLSTREGTKVLDGSEHKWLSTLTTVAVSKHGSIAFVCTKSILYTTMKSEVDDADSVSLRETLRAKLEHSFTHAAFNDDGSLLYAWEYGRPDDCLSVWRIDDAKRNIILPADSEGSYPSKQQGLGTATLVPYNTYHGCIIQAQGNAFFPAQIRSTQRGSKLTLEKKIVTIPKAVGACMYGDHSLLVTTKGTRHTRVWEHRIAGGAMHVIEPAEKPLIEFKCRQGEEVQMRVVSVPDSEDLVIIICLADGRVFTVSVVAQ